MFEVYFWTGVVFAYSRMLYRRGSTYTELAVDLLLWPTELIRLVIRYAKSELDDFFSVMR